jgi:hypothetical protein
MFTVNTVLLSRAPLLPDEWLASYLARLSHLNHYDSVGWMHKLCHSQLSEYDWLILPKNWETVTGLSRMTQQPAKALLEATAHRFAYSLTPPGSEFTTMQLPNNESLTLLHFGNATGQLWSPGDVRYCPSCLQEGSYVRLDWLPILISTCAKHGCLLRSNCHVCRSLLSTEDIAQDFCTECRAKPSRAPVENMKNDDWALLSQHIVRYWLGLAPPPSDYASYLSEDIPARVYYRLLDGLRRGLVAKQSPSNSLPSAQKRYLLPHRVHHIVAQAMKALVNWPHGFYEFLDSYRGHKGPSKSGSVKEDFGYFYGQIMERLWRLPEFRFVQDRFEDYIVEHYRLSASIIHLRRYNDDPSFRERFPFLTEAQVLRMLGTTPRVLERIKEVGRLVPVYTSEKIIKGKKIPGITVYHSDDVQTLYAKWQNTMTLNDVAELVGLSPRVIRDMVQKGLLEAVRGPSVDKGSVWGISFDSVSQLLEQLRSLARTPRDSTYTYVPLLRATQIVSVYQHTMADVLKLILEQKLKCRWRAKDKNEISAIIVSVLDIEKHLSALTGSSPFVSFAYVGLRMGVSAYRAKKWAKNDLFASICGNDKQGDPDPLPYGRVCRKEADAFIANHMFSAVAAEMIGVEPIVLCRWVLRGRLRAVSGPGIDGYSRYLFHRAEIERFLPDNRLTLPEVARLLNLSRSQVWVHVKQSKLKPLSGPGIDDCKHYLFLRSDLERSGLLSKKE